VLERQEDADVPGRGVHGAEEADDQQRPQLAREGEAEAGGQHDRAGRKQQGAAGEAVGDGAEDQGAAGGAEQRGGDDGADLQRGKSEC
jgi:hypothetical protein